MTAAVNPNNLVAELRLPWSVSNEDDNRFNRIVVAMLVVFLVCAVVVPLLPLDERSQDQVVEPPAHLARVILEKKALPEPIPIKPVPIKKVITTPKPPAVEKIKPKPTPVPKPVDRVAEARDKAALAGVMAFQDDLAELRDSVDPQSLNKQQVSRGQSEAAQVQRSVISSAATASSGGITTAQLSSNAGGAALSGRQATRVESNIAATAKRQFDDSASARLGGRSDESIRRVMDRNKGAIYAIYNRALRKDPLLAGKIMFEMVIGAEGEVAEIVLLSSELTDDGLTNKLLSRIRLIQFGADEVISTRVNYSLDFLPYS
ncbi:MAG: AgmX/PglI C-terminal domain-containing protein [Halioglobus sp.]